MSDTRDQMLRRMLVAQVDAVSERRWWQLVVASAGAFALAGALTAGAIVGGVDRASTQPAELRFPDDLLEDDVRVLSSPLVLVVDETMSVELGDKPAGANGLSLVMLCLEAGERQVLFDGRFEAGGSCTEPGSGSGGVMLVDDQAPRTMTVEVSGGRFAISVQWVYQPPDAEPSATQVEALADGIVTREEYLAGFDTYVTCMGDLGFKVLGPDDRDAEILNYSIEGGMSGAANRCYEEHFSLVDMEWQVAHEE